MTKTQPPADTSVERQSQQRTPSGRRRTVRNYDPRSIAPPGEGLADLFPDLYARALGCPEYPELPIARLRVQSNLILEWSCVCGSPTLRQVNNVTNRGLIVCDRCQAAGKSRLEFEVAELLRLGLGVDVLTHYGPRRDGQVDLYFPEYDTAVELDPFTTHRDRHEQDERRLHHHAARYRVVFRVRQDPLPAIAGCLTVPMRAEPLVWARVAAEHVAPQRWIEPSSDEARKARERGAARYWALVQKPPSPSLADRPDVACSFLEDLDVPNRTPEWISVGAGALCLWFCPNGHPPYPAPVDRRTGPQATGCPKCGRARTSAARRRPPPGGAAADVAAEMVGYFIGNLEHPGDELTELKPNAHDRCVWRCARPDCRGTLEETVKGRRARPGAVCRDCRPAQLWETRRANPNDPTNRHWAQALNALDEYIVAYGHARIPAEYVAEMADASVFRLGAWVLQTRKRKSKLIPRQIEDLAARPEWVWTAKGDAWWRTFALLEQYLEREGSVSVPLGHVEGGRRLDAFIAKQRQNHDRGKLPADRVAALETLTGWTWRVRRRRRSAT
jgi:hypothetical protein